MYLDKSDLHLSSSQLPWVCLWPSFWNSETTCSTCWRGKSPLFWSRPSPSSSSTSIRHWTSSSRPPWCCWPSLSTTPAGRRTWSTACSWKSCGSSTERCSRGPEGYDANPQKPLIYTSHCPHIPFLSQHPSLHHPVTPPTTPIHTHTDHILFRNSALILL